jgi:hypothetical protein
VSRNLWRRLLWGGLAAVVFGLATLAPGPRAGAQETKVRLEVPAGGVDVGGAPFPVDVLVDDVTNLGAFEFTLRYDPSILKFVGVEKGPFLASSGRAVECLDPGVTPGSVHYVCVTLGAMPPGAHGSGVLATITLAPAAPGTSSLQLEQPLLAEPSGQALPAASENASITVSAPGAPETPLPTGTPPIATAAQVTPAAPTPTAETPVRPTPTLAATPARTSSSSGGSTNWPLWGSVIGVAAVLVAGGAGVFWWSRVRKLS